MADEFSQQSGGILEQLTIGAAGVAAAALTDSNLVGAMASAATFGALEYFKAKATASNTAIGAAEYAALFEEFRKLDERVGKLEQKDRQDVLTKQAVFSRFARDVSEASTPEKREAIVNATAYQFDPRKGSPATRDYWLQRVRELPEIHLAFLLLIAGQPCGFLNGRLVSAPLDVARGGNIEATELTSIPAPEAEVLAYQQAAEALEPMRLIWQPAGGDISNMLLVKTGGGTKTHVRMFTLLPQGKVLVSYCKDD